MEKINLKSKNNITASDISRANQYIKNVVQYISTLSLNNPGLSNEELIKKLDKEYCSASNQYCNSIIRLADSQIHKIVIKYLLKNKDYLRQEYNKLKNKKLISIDGSHYTYNIAKSSKLLIKNILLETRKNSNVQQIDSDREYQMIISILQEMDNLLPDELQRLNLDILTIAKEFLDKFNIFQKLNNSHNHQLNCLWMIDDLKYILRPNDDFPNDMGIEGLLSYDNLSKMSTEQLSMLNMFWQNKYSKEQKQIGFGLFAIKQLLANNKLDNFASIDIDKIDNLFDDNTIKNLLIKYNILERLSKNIYQRRLNGNTNAKFLDKLSKEYNIQFSQLMPSFENNMITDLEHSIDSFFSVKNTYFAKENLMCGTILDLVNNKKIKNWGYINDYEGSQKNSIQAGTHTILIGIDYPGFNRPIFLHIPKASLQDALLNCCQLNRIPIYQGNSDFSINYEHLTTHLLLPPEKRHLKFVRECPTLKNKNTSSYLYNLLAHIRFLFNQDKLPPSLIGPDGRRKQRKYIDLTTGYILDEHGNLLSQSSPDTEDSSVR